MKCMICTRKTVKGDFCLWHLKAHESIKEEYGYWKKALNVSWREYLSEIEKNPLIGEWVKEVVQYLIRDKETKNA